MCGLSIRLTGKTCTQFVKFVVIFGNIICGSEDQAEDTMPWGVQQEARV